MKLTTLNDLNDSSIKDLKRVFDLESHYIDYLESQERDDRGGVWHPSAIGMCGRRNVYERTNTPGIKTISERSAELFALGHRIHDVVQGILKRLEDILPGKGIQYTFYAEVPTPSGDVLFEEFRIAGTCDGLLEITAKNWSIRAVVEIKSIRDEGWKELSGPQHSHRMQANLYAYRFNAPIIYYWYYNKNNSKRRVFTEAFDPAVFEEAVLRYTELEGYVRREELPPREESFFFCKECPYRKLCEPEVLQTKHSKKVDTVSRFRNRVKV